MIHSILIIGQSNMAGRGHPNEAEPLKNPNNRITVLRNGRWIRAYRPLNPDRATSGVCLAESFLTAYAEDHPEVGVGVIPCADGGTSLDQWENGGLLFDNAVNCARLAMRTSHLVAILWHQGESDCRENLYPHYLEKITAIMAALRRELDAEKIPLIVGGLGDFLKDCDQFPHVVNYPYVNAALAEFAAKTPCTAFVPAEGLSANRDNLHFNARSLNEFGLRYYAAFRTLEDRSRSFGDKSTAEGEVRTSLELL